MAFMLTGGSKSHEFSNIDGIIANVRTRADPAVNVAIDRIRKLKNHMIHFFVQEFGLDIMYLYSLYKDPELRWQAFPRFPEPISLYVLHFLSRFSCILQSKNPAPNPNLVKKLESYAPYFKDWFYKIDIEVRADIEKSLGKRGKTEVQKYKSGSPFKELLRFVRNTWAHITELELSKEILKWDADSFYSYIDARFPGFLMIAYRVACEFCRKEDWFEEFFLCDDICSGILKEEPEFLQTYATARLMSLLMTSSRWRTEWPNSFGGVKRTGLMSSFDDAL